MGTSSVFYWVSVAMCLFAAYLLCFRMYKIDGKHNKTDERIYLPRIMYPLAAVVSFVPVLNFLLGSTMICVAVFACYANEGIYFKSWLIDTPERKEKEPAEDENEKKEG